MLIFYHYSLKNWLSKDIFDFLPPGKGVRLLGQGYDFLAYFPNTQGIHLSGTDTQKFAKKFARGTFIREGTFIRDRIVVADSDNHRREGFFLFRDPSFLWHCK